MSILDRYLWKSVFAGLMMAWLALTFLVIFFDFIREADDLNENYSSIQALVYLLYSIPNRLYELFPTAMLIGTLLSLGNLAANSEFIAMRAAGISIANIIASVLKLGLVSVIAVFLFGEWVVPKADLAGKNFRSSLNSKNVVMVSGASLWIKDRQRIFHVGKVWSENKLSDVTIYDIKTEYLGLESMTQIMTATNSDSGWLMESIVERRFDDGKIYITEIPQRVNPNFLDPKLLSIASVDPEQLSILELSSLIEHQKSLKLTSPKFELAYWKRYSAPFAALVMLLLAMPFLFASQRGGGAGQRVFIGVIVGIVFFLINKVLSQLGSVYGLPPILSAFLPALFFLGVSFVALKQIK